MYSVEKNDQECVDHGSDDEDSGLRSGQWALGGDEIVRRERELSKQIWNFGELGCPRICPRYLMRDVRNADWRRNTWREDGIRKRKEVFIGAWWVCKLEKPMVMGTLNLKDLPQGFVMRRICFRNLSWWVDLWSEPWRIIDWKSWE